jgi:hypothetical protein
VSSKIEQLNDELRRIEQRFVDKFIMSATVGGTHEFGKVCGKYGLYIDGKHWSECSVEDRWRLAVFAPKLWEACENAATLLEDDLKRALEMLRGMK